MDWARDIVTHKQSAVRVVLRGKDETHFLFAGSDRFFICNFRVFNAEYIIALLYILSYQFNDVFYTTIKTLILKNHS